MHNVGVCRIDEIAPSVLTTVIGHQPAKGWVLVDAGWMALAATAARRRGADHGYGAGLRRRRGAGRRLHRRGANQSTARRARGGPRDEDLGQRPLASVLRGAEPCLRDGGAVRAVRRRRRPQRARTWPRFSAGSAPRLAQSPARLASARARPERAPEVGVVAAELTAAPHGPRRAAPAGTRSGRSAPTTSLVARGRGPVGDRVDAGVAFDPTNIRSSTPISRATRACARVVGVLDEQRRLPVAAVRTSGA